MDIPIILSKKPFVPNNVLNPNPIERVGISIGKVNKRAAILLNFLEIDALDK